MNSRTNRNKFMEGYDWKPWTPYSAPTSLRILRGLHNALHLHYPSRDGSWCFGYDYICGGCGMNVGPWPEQKRQQAADFINRLPPEKQQSAAEHISGGRV